MADVPGNAADPIRWEEMLTLAEAALLGGPGAHTLKQQAERGRLRARKIAGRWLTTRRWLEEYLEVYARRRVPDGEHADPGREGAGADGD